MKTVSLNLLGSAMLMLALSATQAYAADLKSGAAVFESDCSDCHSVKAGVNKTGPSLAGIVGRHSASNAQFGYSPAMKAANLTWSADKLEAYITEPRKVVPGTKMHYDGLPDAKLRKDLIAYLETQK